MFASIPASRLVFIEFQHFPFGVATCWRASVKSTLQGLMKVFSTLRLVI